MPGTNDAPQSPPVRLDQEFYQDPGSVYARLPGGPARPVTMPDGRPGWLVTSYGDARALLADPRLSKDAKGVAGVLPAGLEGAFASPLMANMLFSDPPDHTRLRRLVNKAFTVRQVERLRPRIEQTADRLLGGLPGGAPVDLVERYALPLPMIVICDLLGVPAADRDTFRDWTLRFVTDLLPGEEDKAVTGLRMAQYLGGLVEEKRASPGDDLLSELVQVSDEDDRLAPGEILSMAFLLLTAGFETTVNLIANGLLTLLRHPDQLALVRSRPSLLPGAIEEFLRYEGPVHVATERFTTEPVLVGDTEIPAGQLVHISLLAADRDGERFADPGRFDVTRQPGGHLAFGHGVHHCVGAPLARMEGAIAIGRLLSRFPGLTPDGDLGRLRWHDSTLMRGLRSLPVRLSGN